MKAQSKALQIFLLDSLRYLNIPRILALTPSSCTVDYNAWPGQAGECCHGLHIRDRSVGADSLQVLVDAEWLIRGRPANDARENNVCYEAPS